MSTGEEEPIALPMFTGGDVVRLFAATYLRLCRVLEVTGALDTKVLALADALAKQKQPV